jgi:diguanylate cyclase (GGDEF)-like protein
MHGLVDGITLWATNGLYQQDLQTYSRARLLVSGVLLCWLILIPLLLLLQLLLWGHFEAQRFALLMAFAGMASWAVALLLLNIVGSFILCVHLLVASGIVLIVFAVLKTGGIDSPVLVAIIIPPVLAAIFTHRALALFWAFMASLACFVVLALQQSFISQASLIPQHSHALISAVFMSFACFIVVAVLYIYEALNQQVTQLLDSEREKFSQLAHRDELTGLANRLHFNASLQQLLHQAKEQEKNLALLYIDLDDFKPINDQYGHEVGDQVLKIAAQRMSRCIRDSDILARLGGDEFVIILNDIECQESLSLVADKIQRSLTQPIKVFDFSLSIGASIGSSISSSGAIEAKELLQMADHNMYGEKAAKKRS